MRALRVKSTECRGIHVGIQADHERGGNNCNGEREHFEECEGRTGDRTRDRLAIVRSGEQRRRPARLARFKVPGIASACGCIVVSGLL